MLECKMGQGRDAIRKRDDESVRATSAAASGAASVSHGYPGALTVLPLPGVPLVRHGDRIAEIAIDAMDAIGLHFMDGDVLVLAQKIVSKAEGRQIALDDITPSDRAIELSREIGKDARLVEAILMESDEVLRQRPDVIIVRQRLGLVLANAGIDQSNVGEGRNGTQALLLPIDPDSSAAQIRTDIAAAADAQVAVLINDSLGRAWRMGTIGTAIGVAGIPALVDLRGREDLNGRPLQSSELAFADEVAAAASLVMGQANEGRPMVLIRGLGDWSGSGRAADLIRPRHMDLFR